MNTRTLTHLLALAALCCCMQTALAQGTTFTYQGRLADAGQPADGTYDLTFSLRGAATGPSQIGGTLTNLSTDVANGFFTVALDFGPGIFDGSPRWLEVGRRAGTPGLGGGIGRSPARCSEAGQADVEQRSQRL